MAVLLCQLSEDFDVRFAEKNVGFQVEAAPYTPVRGEPDALYRAFSNLTENALRYTDSGAVNVSAKNAHGEVVITFNDSGIGIPSESLDRLFERFYRVEKSRSRQSGGVGLGLSIVKTIIEAHRGKLSVTSEMGKGTRFTVSLPTV